MSNDTTKNETTKNKLAILALADGTVFRGVSVGATGETTGEVVFNTSMTGYQEILTDPSYLGQLVTLTYPHIGNTGCNSEDAESGRIHKVWANGLIIRDLPLLYSNFRTEQSLGQYLNAHNVVAIAEIDTRKLTRILRDKGAQNGCILTYDDGDTDKAVAQAIKKAQAFVGLNGLDLAKTACDPEGFHWREGVWTLDGFGEPKADYHVVAYDFGTKTNILRMLAERGCRLSVVPATTPAEKVLAMNPDGIFLSNGPGDPAACDYAITAIGELLTHHIPLFGICLGHQLLALASGAKTVKMKFGHHGANHPVQDLADGTVMITSQNHGFAVDETTLPETLKVTHRSLFDGSNQGIERIDTPAFSFQGHPEASPGPHDCGVLFDRFVSEIEKFKA